MRGLIRCVSAQRAYPLYLTLTTQMIKACSTCHVIIKDENVYRQLEEDIPATDEENDMLDLAFGLTETYVCPSLKTDLVLTFSLHISCLVHVWVVKL